MKATVVIRNVTEADLPTLYEVQNTCYAKELQDDLDVMRARFQLCSQFQFIAEEVDGTSPPKPLGHLIAHRHSLLSTLPAHNTAPEGFPPLEDCDCIYFHDLSVKPSARGKRVSERLVTAALSAAFHAGLYSAELTSVHGTTGFWGKFGFEPRQTSSQAELASYGQGAVSMVLPRILPRHFHPRHDTLASALPVSHDEAKQEASKLKALSVEENVPSVVIEAVSPLDSEPESTPDQWETYEDRFQAELEDLFPEPGLISILSEYHRASILETWIGRSISKLLYRASRDGWSNAKFHDLADSQGSTLTAVHLKNGTVFGGYTEAAWNSNGGSQDCGERSFLFSLARVNGPVRLDCIPTSEKPRAPHTKFGMGCSRLCGPVLGMYDLSLNLENMDLCRSNPGRTFATPPNLAFGTPSAQSFLAGGIEKWGRLVQDVYVFRV